MGVVCCGRDVLWAWCAVGVMCCGCGMLWAWHAVTSSSFSLRCLTFGNRVITVTDEVATSSPNAHNTSSGAFIGAISFLCLALCVAVVVGMTVGALLFAKKKKLVRSCAAGVVCY